MQFKNSLRECINLNVLIVHWSHFKQSKCCPFIFVPLIRVLILSVCYGQSMLFKSNTFYDRERSCLELTNTATYFSFVETRLLFPPSLYRVINFLCVHIIRKAPIFFTVEIPLHTYSWSTVTAVHFIEMSQFYNEELKNDCFYAAHWLS